MKYLEMIEKNNFPISLLYGALKRKTYRCSQQASSFYYISDAFAKKSMYGILNPPFE